MEALNFIDNHTFQANGWGALGRDLNNENVKKVHIFLVLFLSALLFPATLDLCLVGRVPSVLPPS